MSDEEFVRRRDAMLNVVSAAQCVAGAIAARRRGDTDDAAELLASVSDPQVMVEGAILLSEVVLGLYREQTNETLDGCVRDLNLRMEAVARTIAGDPPAGERPG